MIRFGELTEDTRMRARSVGLPLLVTAVALIATAASAQTEPDQGMPAAPAAGAEPKAKGIKSPYSVKVQKANAAYVSRDFPGAIAAYREAIQETPNDPVVFYLLGEAQLGGGNIGEAEATWLTALGKAGSKDDIRAKLMFVLADLRERQGKWAEAKTAWDEYARFVGSHSVAKGYAATAAERNKAIDTRVDLETKYGAVKQRIEQREKEAAAPPPAAAPEPANPVKAPSKPVKKKK
jgi:predicted Zn-dependent protease